MPADSVWVKSPNSAFHFFVSCNRTRSSWTLWHSARLVSVPLWRSVWKASSVAPRSWPTRPARATTAVSASWLSATRSDRPFKTCWASTWTTWVFASFQLMFVFWPSCICKDFRTAHKFLVHSPLHHMLISDHDILILAKNKKTRILRVPCWSRNHKNTLIVLLHNNFNQLLWISNKSKCVWAKI